MSLSLFLARRIYRGGDAGRQVSRPAVLIAMTGIAIGLAVMIITVSMITINWHIMPMQLQTLNS